MCTLWRSQYAGTGAVSEAEAHFSTSEVLITFNCKSDVCASLALSNKHPYDERTAAPLKFYFKK